MVTSRSSAGGGSPAAAAQRAAGRRPRRRRAARASRRRAASAISARSSAGRARGDREHGARAVDQHERRVERARGGADDLGQAEAGLDRVRDRRERAEVERAAAAACWAGADHRREPSRAGRSTRGTRRRRQAPGEHEGGEDVDAQHDAPRSRSRRRQYDVHAGTTTRASQATSEISAGGADDDVGDLVVVHHGRRSL